MEATITTITGTTTASQLLMPLQILIFTPSSFTDNSFSNTTTATIAATVTTTAVH